MDLDVIGKQMLEALAVQGRIAALETTLAELERQIVEVNGYVEGSKVEKLRNIEARKQAETGLSVTTFNAEEEKRVVAEASASLKLVLSTVKVAKEELAKYSDEVLNQLDVVTSKLEKDKKVVEGNKDEVLKELDVARQDLETRQTELKVLGIELSLGGAKAQAKTTVL